MKKASREEAFANPTQHALILGHGYVQMEGPLVPGKHLGLTCLAPRPIANDSLHMLRPPRGAKPIEARWVELHRAWAMRGGKRLALPADYLASHGWSYEGPVI